MQLLTKLLIISLLLSFTNTKDNCDCYYKGKISEFKWNDKLKIFQPSIMQLGELSINVDFTFCDKSKKRINISGNIFDENNIYKKGDLKKNVIIYKINKGGKVLDTLNEIKSNGDFFINSCIGHNFLIFYEKQKKKGVAYNLRKFSNKP